jgi:hypothetical protein
MWKDQLKWWEMIIYWLRKTTDELNMKRGTVRLWPDIWKKVYAKTVTKCLSAEPKIRRNEIHSAPSARLLEEPSFMGR